MRPFFFFISLKVDVIEIYWTTTACFINTTTSLTFAAVPSVQKDVWNAISTMGTTWRCCTSKKVFLHSPIMTHLVQSLSSWRGVFTIWLASGSGHILQILFGMSFSDAKTLRQQHNHDLELRKESITVQHLKEAVTDLTLSLSNGSRSISVPEQWALFLRIVSAVCQRKCIPEITDWQNICKCRKESAAVKRKKESLMHRRHQWVKDHRDVNVRAAISYVEVFFRTHPVFIQNDLFRMGNRQAGHIHGSNKYISHVSETAAMMQRFVEMLTVKGNTCEVWHYLHNITWLLQLLHQWSWWRSIGCHRVHTVNVLFCF